VDGGVEHGQRALDRAAGARDVVLVGDQDPGRQGAGVRDDLVAGVPDDDHDAARLELLRGRDGVAEHRPPAEGVQHLGGARSHPGALTGGEDDHGGGPGLGHDVGLPSEVPERYPGCADVPRHSTGVRRTVWW
jgi:hypothetical protein